MDSYEILRRHCGRGWEKLESTVPLGDIHTYLERIKYELSVIKKLNFSNYFLIVEDFVNWAKGNSIRVGPGRGSAAGSLVSYLLGVTKLDPIKHGLLFERFLNEGRKSLPDADIDFMDSRRDEVFDYLKKKWGEDHVAMVITYARSLGRGMIKDVARVMDISPEEANRITKEMLFDDTIEESIATRKRLQPYVQKYPKLFEIACKLQGMMKATSQHAAGVVVTPEPISEMMPICTGKKGVSTQWDKDDLEKMGFAKFDVLSLKTLTIIQETLDLIGPTEGLKFDIDKLPLDDKEVFAIIQRGWTLGVFQFETDLNMKLLREIKPTTFDELIACVSLGRPGAKDGVEYYVGGKNGQEIDYLHQSLESVLKETYGCLIYQEQSMKIAQILAGFTLPEADDLRRAISKSVHGGVEKLWDRWLEGTRKNGVGDDTSKMIFDIIKQSERYSFNKSHAAVYAYIAYQTAWLKIHYPQEFMSVLMTNCSDVDEKLWDYIKDAKKMQIPVFSVDVNKSKARFVPERDGIRFGLASIKGIGSAANEVEKKAPYVSFEDFCSKVNRSMVRRDAIKALISAGAMDCFGESQESMIEKLETDGKGRPTMESSGLFGESSSLNF